MVYIVNRLVSGKSIIILFRRCLTKYYLRIAGHCREVANYIIIFIDLEKGLCS